MLTDIGAGTLIATMAVCFVAAMISGLSGFGTGLLITLFITPIIGVKAVIPVMSVLMTITNFSRVLAFRGELSGRSIALISITAVPASIWGANLYVDLDTSVIQFLLGAVLVASVPLRRVMKGRQIVAGPVTLLIFGLIYGVLASLTMGAGILLIPMLLGAGLAGPALLATDAAISTLINFVKIIAFGRLDALTLPLLGIAVAMGLCTVPGTWAGAWIVRRTNVSIHNMILEVTIIVGGLIMLLDIFRS
jgi:uncharacterized membrane protein YfcA